MQQNSSINSHLLPSSACPVPAQCSILCDNDCDFMGDREARKGRAATGQPPAAPWPLAGQKGAPAKLQVC